MHEHLAKVHGRHISFKPDTWDPFRIGDHRHRKGPHGKPGLRRKYVAVELKGGWSMGL